MTRRKAGVGGREAAGGRRDVVSPQLPPTKTRRRDTRPSLPVIHQPLVAISLILIVATAAQLAVWLVNVRLLANAPRDIGLTPPPAVLADTSVFETITAAIHRLNVSGVPDGRVIFGVFMVAALLSNIGWYAAARKMLGPAWGLWIGMACAVTPLAAMLAQRPGPTTLTLVLVPAAWALMIAWSRTRRRQLAFLAGVAAGLTCVAGMVFTVVLMVASVPLLIATRFRRKVLTGFALLLVGAALPISLVTIWPGTRAWSAPLRSFSADWLMAEPNESPIAAASLRARVIPGADADPRLPLQLIGDAARHSPGELLSWFGGRVWRCTYATEGGQFRRPLFAAQLVLLVPAIWGLIVCQRVAEWRWMGVAGGVLVACYWMLVAIAEPLARNLAPVTGMLVIFAAVAVADAYERAFGRRLRVEP